MKRFLSAPSSPQNESRSLSSGLLRLPLICTASRMAGSSLSQKAPPWVPASARLPFPLQHPTGQGLLSSFYRWGH